MRKLVSFVFIFLVVCSILPIEKTYQNSRKIKFAFTLSDMRPFLKMKRIILWVTENNGINWYKADKFNVTRNEKGDNYIEWDAFKDGDFGFILSYELEGLRESPKPSLFDLPQYIVSVDTKGPKILYFRSRYIDKNRGILKLKWKVVDRNLSSQGIKLLYKKNGEYQVLNDSMPEEGDTTWYITDSSKKYIQFSIIAKDLAGNEVNKVIRKKNLKFSGTVQTPMMSREQTEVENKKYKKQQVQSQNKLPEDDKNNTDVEVQKKENNIYIVNKEEQKDSVIQSQNGGPKSGQNGEVGKDVEENITVHKQEEDHLSKPKVSLTRNDGKRVIPVRIPVNISGDKSRLASVVVYYTTDRGKNWNKYYELSPYDNHMIFYAEKEKLYGFYFVFKTKDNINFPDEPKSGDVPSLYKYIDITVPKVKMYTPSTDILIAGKMYRIGWKIYDKNLDISNNKLSVSYDAGKNWHLLAKSISKKGKMNYRAPMQDLDGVLLFKLEAQDFAGLSSSIVSKLYTVRKYDFDISFSDKAAKPKKAISKPKKVVKGKQEIPKEQTEDTVIKKPKIDYVKIEQLLKDVKVMIAQGEYYDALQNLRRVIEEDINNMEALSLMGYIHTLQENYSESIKVLSHAFTVDCSDFTNFYNLEIGLIKVNNIFDSVSKLIDFLKCVSVDSLDKNKKGKLDTIISILNKKSDALSDNSIKSKLNYVKSLYTTPQLESVRK